MVQRISIALLLLGLPMAMARAATVEAAAVADSLLQDIDNARSLLQVNRSPWQDPAARPQAEPLAVLRGDLPGDCIWAAFKPVDCRVRQAYRLQRQGYIVKDAAVRERSEALELLPDLAVAIRSERGCYNRRVISTAVRQVNQVDNALRHMEYYSALCVLWSMADLLGLWDRQAALEVAEEHLGTLRKQGSGRSELRARQAEAMGRKLDTIARMIQGAIQWQPLPESIGPGAMSALAPRRGSVERHFADPAVLGGAFGDWRDNGLLDGSATPLVFDAEAVREALSVPAPETRCLHVCATRYRDWQYELDDYRYGWIVYTDTAGEPHHIDCDWRNLKPPATWPGAGGAENAGGL